MYVCMCISPFIQLLNYIVWYSSHTFFLADDAPKNNFVVPREVLTVDHRE